MMNQFVALALICTVFVVSADDVIVGTGANFNQLVKDNEFLVAEFYAPWCGHCKSLEPEYAKAATALRASETPIVLVKVDATQEANKELATKFGVQGFPTLKIFRDGNIDQPQEYKGPRDSAGIIKYLEKKSQPASSSLDTEEKIKAFTQEEPAILGVFSSVESADFNAFLSVAGRLSDDYEFAHTTLKSALGKSGKAPTIKLFKASEGKELTYNGKFEESVLQKWVESNALPLLIDLDEKPKNREAVQKAFASEGPRFFTFFEKDSAAGKDLRPALNKLAETLIGDTFFINIDPSNNQHALDFFGIKKEQTPAFVIQSGKDKFVESNVVSKQLAKFWKDFKAGVLKKTIKSEEPPKDNTKPVTIATGNTLEQVAFGGKNVLIEFYAPWCGHCKRLEPVYEKVGKHFEANDSVVIAKMDATANDVTSEKFDVSGFPTLYFVDSKGNVELYGGERSESDLIAFVEKQAGKSSPGSDVSDDHSEL